MNIKTLWETPKESWNGNSELSFNFKGLEAVLKIEYKVRGEKRHIYLKFNGVCAYKFLRNHLYNSYSEANTLGSFESLIEIVDSEWIKELQQNDIYGNLTHCRHFALSNHDDGQIEIIAESYFIEE